MNLRVNGEDVSAALGEEVSAAAAELARRPGPHRLAREHSAARLAEAADEAEFERRYLRLLGRRHGVDLFAIPPPAPARGALRRAAGAVRSLAWRLVRPRLNDLVVRQNVVNEMTASALDFQDAALRREVAALRRRVEALERGRGPGAGDGRA